MGQVKNFFHDEIELNAQFNDVFYREPEDQYEWESEISVLEYQLQDMKNMPLEKRKQHRERLIAIRENINDLIGA